MRFRAYSKENTIPPDEGQKILRVLERAVTALSKAAFPKLEVPRVRLSSRRWSRFLANYNRSFNLITFWWTHVKTILMDNKQLIEVRNTILHELAHHGVSHIFSLSAGGKEVKQAHGKEFRAVTELLAIKFNINPHDIYHLSMIPKQWLDEEKWTRPRGASDEWMTSMLERKSTRGKRVNKDIDRDFLLAKLNDAIQDGIKIGFIVPSLYYTEAFIGKFDKVLYAYDPQQFTREKNERFRANRTLTAIRHNPTDERGHLLRNTYRRTNSKYLALNHKGQVWLVIFLAVPRHMQSSVEEFLESRGVNTDAKPIEDVFDA